MSSTCAASRPTLSLRSPTAISGTSPVYGCVSRVSMKPERDAVDRDVVAAPVLRERACHPDQRGLGGGVAELRGRAEEPGDGRDVHDLPRVCAPAVLRDLPEVLPRRAEKPERA